MAEYLVVMAGGSGTRFWPKSTSKKPKQLLAFAGKKSLLRLTLERFPEIPAAKKWIVTTRKLQRAIKADVPKTTHVLAEPEARNTAPCIYWAARKLAAHDPEGIMLVMPADHHIPNGKAFRSTVEKAVKWAKERDDLVTLGIRPTRPETGYGYLRMGSDVSSECKKVEAFVEKPDLQKARGFLSAGNYLWNGGMFVWKARVVLEAFDRYLPEYSKVWNQAKGKVEKAYPKLQATSIDYGIMEKASNVVTFPLDCGWDDLGSWPSLENLAVELSAVHPAGVVTSGECISIDADSNVVDVPGKLVALLGVKDLIIVQNGDALLIADKSRAQDIKKIVDEVKTARPDLA